MAEKTATTASAATSPAKAVPAASATSTASAASASQALLDMRPPATDRFTYLTFIGENLSPELLPTLHTVLQDAHLTQEIGWDLVDMLVPLLPASEACLDDVARLGNPREVILKVLEGLERLRVSGGPGVDEEEEEAEESDDDERGKGECKDSDEKAQEPSQADTQTFIVLLGMLGLLHRRIKTKYPSRFLESTLRTILAAYRPEDPAMTTAVLGLMRSLAEKRRPPPPARRSDSQMSLSQMGKAATGAAAETASTKAEPTATAPEGSSQRPASALSRSSSAIAQVASNSGRPDDAVVAVPDPEAEGDMDPAEGALQQRLLQSFVTCVLEAYVNANDMAWAPRLLEHYRPEKLVPGRPTMLQRFREEPERREHDEAVGQLMALALDLGLQNSEGLVKNICQGPVRRRPLAHVDVAAAPSGSTPEATVPLSTGGSICVLAYWVFSSAVFQAGAPVPQKMHMFPELSAMLATFLRDDAASQIARTPGTVDALVAIGLWLDHTGEYGACRTDSETDSVFMPFLHLLTLCAVFHPSLAVRNASTTLAGAVLHADADAEDRLRILQDLLENCMFASLKACAVTWLREEIMSGGGGGGSRVSSSSISSSNSNSNRSPFASTYAVEQLQYAIFPDLQSLRDAKTQVLQAEEDKEAMLLEYWVQNAPFLQQAANFAYFLFGSDRYRAAVPPGMGPAVEQRFVEPLLQGVARLQRALQEQLEDQKAQPGKPDKGTDGGHSLEEVALDLEVLISRLTSLNLS